MHHAQAASVRPWPPLSAALGSLVLARLAGSMPLPPCGYLVGQAVCTVLLGAHQEDSAPLDDINVLIDRAAIDRLDDLLVAVARDARTVGLRHHHRARAIGAWPKRARVGRLDLLVCASLPPLAELLAEGDLNCVQVGVDLATGQLYWSAAFETFYRMRTLRVMNLRTPAATMLRYVRKSRHARPGIEQRSVFRLFANALEISLRQGWGCGEDWQLDPAAAHELQDHSEFHRWFGVREVEQACVGAPRAVELTLRGPSQDALARLPACAVPVLLPLLAEVQYGLCGAAHGGALAALAALAREQGTDGRGWLVRQWRQHGHGFADLMLEPERLRHIEMLAQQGLGALLSASTLSGVNQRAQAVDQAGFRFGPIAPHLLREAPADLAPERFWSWLDARLYQPSEQFVEHPAPLLRLGPYVAVELTSATALAVEDERMRSMVSLRCAEVASGATRIFALHHPEGPARSFTAVLTWRQCWSLDQLHGHCGAGAPASVVILAERLRQVLALEDAAWPLARLALAVRWPHLVASIGWATLGWRTLRRQWRAVRTGSVRAARLLGAGASQTSGEADLAREP